MKVNAKSQSVTLVLLVLIVVFANLASIRFFLRLDITRGKIYSLSRASKSSVKELNDRLVVKAYFTEKLPGQLADTRRYTLDLLNEYKAYSRGKMTVEFIDPKDEDKLKEEAAKNRIQPVTMRVPEKDKLEIREVYLGLAFLYNDKLEIIPVVQNSQGLEYDITRAIKRVTSQKMQKVAFYEGQQLIVEGTSAESSSRYNKARQFIGQNYEMVRTNLDQPLAGDIKVLVMAGVEDSLAENRLYNLDQFLMQSGKLLLFQDMVKCDLQRQIAQPLKSNIFRYLSVTGVNIQDNIVGDALCGQINIQETRGFFSFNVPISYPYFPLISSFPQEPIVKNLDQVQTVFPSEIAIGNLDAQATFTPLLSTSDKSGAIKGPRYDISFEKFRTNEDLSQMFTEQPKIVGGLYHGKMKSFYTPIEGKSSPAHITFNDSAEFIVVADADMISDPVMGVPGNINFLQNSIDYLSGDASLIELRSREVSYRPLKELQPLARNLVKWANILLPALLLILFGLLRLQHELSRRRWIKELYEQK